MNKKIWLFLVFTLFSLSVICYPIVVNAQPQYANKTNNQCSYCHNSGYSLNSNGQAYIKAGYPAVNGWKNSTQPVKKIVTKTKLINKTTKKSSRKLQNRNNKIKYHKKSPYNHHKKIENEENEQDDD